MSIDIIPPGSSAVITDRHDRSCDRGHDRHHESKHPDRWDLSTQMSSGFTADALSAAHTDELSGNQMRTGFTAEALAATHSDELNCDSFSEAQKQLSDSTTATVVGFKDSQSLAYQLQGKSLLEAAKNAAAQSIQTRKESDGLFGQAISNFNLSSIQSTTQFNALTVQSNLNQYNILLDSQKNSAASVLLATQLASVAAAQAAACCCELKEKIGAEGQLTRDLVSSIQMQDLRDRAARSETALSAYFSAKVAPSAPVI